jgi:deoxyribose-phosphate aldolase
MSVMADFISREELAKMIDHSLLKPELTRQQTADGIQIALKHRVAAVTVKPCDVALAAEMVSGSSVKVNPVIGFPLGYDTTLTKVFATSEAMVHGAHEIDMVINIGALLGGEDDLVQEDIAAVVKAADDAPVKVILEIAYLNNDQIVRACQLCEAAGARFVKTSSGFAASGYTLEALKLMRASVSAQVQVKAAHGVRTLDDALAVRAVGVTRFGATQTEKIMAEWETRFGK